MNIRNLALVVLMIAGGLVLWDFARPPEWEVFDREEIRERVEREGPFDSSPPVELANPANLEEDRQRTEAAARDRIPYPEKVEGGPPVLEEEVSASTAEEEEDDSARTDFDDFIEDFVETSFVRGRLLAESGGFEVSALALNKAIVVELSSRESRGLSMQADLEFVMEADGTRSIAFAFEEVPLGHYELSVSSLGNQRWAPESRQVYPPEEGLEFMRYDLDETSPVRFLVTNAETGEPVTDYRLRTIRATHSDENGVFLHTGPLNASSIPEQGSCEWTLDAPGFAPAFGDETSFFSRLGQRMCEVQLTPGWATRFLVLGTESRGSDGEPVTVALQGAEISLDDVVVGLTGADGTLTCSRREEPGEIQVRYGNQVYGGAPGAVIEGRSASQRGNVSVILMRSESE